MVQRGPQLPQWGQPCTSYRIVVFVRPRFPPSPPSPSCASATIVRAAEDSKSAAPAKQLVQVLDTAKLDSIAAVDPSSPNRFVAAIYIAETQLLVVSAQVLRAGAARRQDQARGFPRRLHGSARSGDHRHQDLRAGHGAGRTLLQDRTTAIHGKKPVRRRRSTGSGRSPSRPRRSTRRRCPTPMSATRRCSRSSSRR